MYHFTKSYSSMGVIIARKIDKQIFFPINVSTCFYWPHRWPHRQWWAQRTHKSHRQRDKLSCTFLTPERRNQNGHRWQNSTTILTRILDSEAPSSARFPAEVWQIGSPDNRNTWGQAQDLRPFCYQISKSGDLIPFLYLLKRPPRFKTFF